MPSSRTSRKTKKQNLGGAAIAPPKVLSPLDEIEAELGRISPRLKDLKHNDPGAYRETYKRFMWLIAEREKLKNG
jgi:hypothetical protein